MLTNTSTRYGTVARALHWLLAVVLAAVFGLGWWATELGYYDSLYRTVPDLHRSLGLVAAGLVLVRIVWALINPRPALAPSLSAWERFAARAGHLLLYVAMVAVPVTGYLLSTADGRSVSVFGFVEVPAALPASSGREETAGMLHYYLAFGAAWLVVVHVLAALKHHFIDRDDTMRKMIGSVRSNQGES